MTFLINFNISPWTGNNLALRIQRGRWIPLWSRHRIVENLNGSPLLALKPSSFRLLPSLQSGQLRLVSGLVVSPDHAICYLKRPMNPCVDYLSQFKAHSTNVRFDCNILSASIIIESNGRNAWMHGHTLLVDMCSVFQKRSPQNSTVLVNIICDGHDEEYRI